MLRRARVYMLFALILALPHQATAQGFGISGGPAPGPTNGFRFSFAAGPQGPVSLTYLKFFFTTPGWSFTGTTYSGADPFSPGGFGVFDLAVASAQSVEFDFWNDLGWFEINDGFVSYLDLAGQATGPGYTTNFGYSATDITGATFDGTGSLNVTPEPVSMLLLGSGLAGLGAVRRRRKNRTPST